MPLTLSGSNGVAGVDGSAGTPALQGSDSNTGIAFGADTIIGSTGGSERFRVDSSGRLGIGTTSVKASLDIGTSAVASAQANTLLALESTVSSNWIEFCNSGTTNNAGIQWSDAGSSDNASIYYDNNTGNLLYKAEGSQVFRTNGANERARIDSSGRLLVGTSSTSEGSTLLLQGYNGGTAGAAILRLCTTSATPADGAVLGYVIFGDSAHKDGAWIRGERDGGTWSTTSKPTRLVFSTTADGASSPTERFTILQSGHFKTGTLYNRTSAVAANVYVDSDTSLYRATSSGKYKTDVETLEDTYADALLECRPVWYRSLCEGDNPNHGWWGFIAEEVAEIDPRLVHWKTTEISYDDKGSMVETPCEPEPEGVQYDRFVPHLLNLIKRQKEQIEAMEARLTAAGIA